jgi:hypothetical protein
MRSVALLTLGLLAACYPAIAKPQHAHRHVARTVHHTHHTHIVRHARVVHRASVTHHTDATTERVSHSGITCEMVRAYVAQVGLAQAAAMAESAGITASEKERAKRCLAKQS